MLAGNNSTCFYDIYIMGYTVLTESFRQSTQFADNLMLTVAAKDNSPQ